MPHWMTHDLTKVFVSTLLEDNELVDLAVDCRKITSYNYAVCLLKVC